MNSTLRARSRAMRGIATIGLMAVLASGCQVGLGEGGTGKETPATGQEEPVDDGTAAEEDAASDGGGTGSDGEPDAGNQEETVVDEDAQAAGVDLTDAGEPIASSEVPAVVEGDPEATMTVSLHSLTREGETLVAVYSFRVNASDAADDAPEWIYRYLGEAGWSPYAIDTKNLAKHGVLSDDSGSIRAQTDYQGTQFRPGQTFYAYAMFAAPPADVTTMDVHLVDGAPLATGVEIA